MNAVVNLPVSPPFPEGKAPLLAQLTEGLDAASLWWLSGYAAGLAGRASTAQADPIVAPAAAASADLARLTIVYGSQTGNSKRLAERLAQQSESAGVAAVTVVKKNIAVQDVPVAPLQQRLVARGQRLWLKDVPAPKKKS